MGLITATFFECGVRYERTTEEGTTKKVNELYIVDALTFTEAESRITEEMQPFVSGDFDVMTLKRTRYSEYDNSEGDKYYKAKIMFITLDEKTQKEKRSSVNYLINAGTLPGAVKNIEEVMSQSMVDYDTVSVSETTLMDVFEYKKKERDDKPEYEQQ